MSERTVASNKKRAKNIHPRLYRIYYGMMSRCNNANYEAYKHYGARGIKVCNEWAGNFQAFQVWALSHGYDGRIAELASDKGGLIFDVIRQIAEEALDDIENNKED